jgi:stage IV sporulation protein FB
MPSWVCCGVRVRIHPLLLAALALAAVTGLAAEAAVLLVVLVTHEMAHLVVARCLELEVVEVDLMPFGGLARIEGLRWADPGVEATVAVAGPLNNFILLAVALGLRQAGWLSPVRGSFFLTANLALGLFNLIPALPLDGGRVLRALLSQRLGFGAATALLCRWGRWLGLASGAAGLAALALGSAVPALWVLAPSLYSAAREERWMSAVVAWRQLWRKGEDMERARLLPLRPLAAWEGVTLDEVARRLAPQRYHLLWVVDHVLGSLDEAALLDGLRRLGPGARLGDLLA